MRSAVLCYAAEDAAAVLDLGGFLELNCPLKVSHDEGRIRAGYDLLAAAERALSADVALVFLSPDSMPRAWRREQWEPIFFEEPRDLGTQIIFVLLRDCKFPEVFRRKTFFDLSRDRLAGQRALKRWLLEQAPSFQSAIELPAECPPAAADRVRIAELQYRLADRPGVESDIGREVALAFAHTCVADFEGVFWLNCASRSRAGLLGDAAHQLGLKLSGRAEDNRRALGNFCALRRCLFIFEHVAPEDRELVAFRGKASVIFTAPDMAPTSRSLAETIAIFSAWTRDPAQCLAALGDAQSHLRGIEFSDDDERAARISLGSSMFALLRYSGRLAEALEVLEVLASALPKGDLLAAHRWEWEKSWILEDWGEPIATHAPAPLANEPVQLTLEFGPAD